MKYFHIKTNGYILFVAVALTLCSTLIIAGYMASMPSETLRLNRKIAQTKALYNAETGIAQKAYPFLIKSAFTSDTTLAGESINQFSSGYNHGVDMGLYLDPQLSFSDSGERVAIVEGVSFIITGEHVKIMSTREKSKKYIYCVDDLEKK